VVEQLLTSVGIAGIKGAKIVDLVASTGKFTKLLATRPEQFEITAVEPHDGTGEQLLQEHLRGPL
jgi:hypothetical protein